MKVLVVTGKVAESEVRKAVSDIVHDVKIYVMPITVASFLTPQIVAENLRNQDLSCYDMILLPGTINGDVTSVERITGIPTFKGPVHAAEIPLALSTDVSLSKINPANVVLNEKLEEKVNLEFRKVEENWEKILKEKGGIVIGRGKEKLPFGEGFPMRVIAEIVNAPSLDTAVIEKKAVYFEEQGAHIIDIGMLAGNSMPGSVVDIIQTIRKVTNLPISVDTVDTGEINSALIADVEMILSLDAGNIHEVAPNVGETAVVILPTNLKAGYLPRDPKTRVKHLKKNIEIAREYGIRNIIADLVVEPLLNPGLMDALESYRIFNREYPDIPTLFGMGNVTELIDADSIGVNASIAALASEVGANLLHIPEYSDKAYGSVKEAVIASKMMWIADKRASFPKDLGIDLLILKEKKRIEQYYNSSLEKIYNVIQVYPDEELVLDPDGWFKILIDRETKCVVAIHYSLGEKEPDLIIKGSNSKQIYQTIIRENLISKLDHAAYLGKELEKACIALKLGRSYVQDEPVFN